MSIENPNNGEITVDEVYRQIMSRVPEHDFDPSLDRMEMALDLLGHPEESFRVIHVTGTNGKGSTARMAEALCRTYGMRTGLYTSPHVEKVTERIAIDGQHLSDEAFVDVWEQVKDFIDLVDAKSIEQGGPKMSFFEVLTTMAIWAFADAPVDVAIVEVGMGGRWDATNVLNADAAVIGPVDMDHMQWLGDTVEQIASEKAGIIKPNSTVIVGPQEYESVYEIIQERAQEVGAQEILSDGNQLEVTNRMPAVGGQVADLTTTNGTYEQVPISMFGEHQAHNALAALAAAEVVIPTIGKLDDDVVDTAFSTVRVPGRIEVIRNSPTTIIDGGHNIQAVTALRAALEENFDFQQLVGVVSMMRDKEVEDVLGVMEPILSTVIVTQNSWNARVMPAQELEVIAQRVFGEDRVTRCDELPDAIQAAVDQVDEQDELGIGYGRGIVIFGSFVTAGDARALLKPRHNSDLEKPKELRATDEQADWSDVDEETGVSDDNSDGSKEEPIDFLSEIMHDGITAADYQDPEFDDPNYAR